MPERVFIPSRQRDDPHAQAISLEPFGGAARQDTQRDLKGRVRPAQLAGEPETIHAARRLERHDHQIGAAGLTEQRRT